jgi:hypothetical protein
MSHSIQQEESSSSNIPSSEAGTQILQHQPSAPLSQIIAGNGPNTSLDFPATSTTMGPTNSGRETRDSSLGINQSSGPYAVTAPLSCVALGCFSTFNTSAERKIHNLECHNMSIKGVNGRAKFEVCNTVFPTAKQPGLIIL